MTSASAAGVLQLVVPERAEGEGVRAWAPAALPPAVHVLSAADVMAGLFGAPYLSPEPEPEPNPRSG